MDEGAPTSYQAVDPGTPVLASDGERVGFVVRVLAAADKDIFDGIVIQTAAGERFVDAPEVERCAEHAVHVRIAASEVAGLPQPTPGTPVYRADDIQPAELDQPRPDPRLRAFRPILGPLAFLAYTLLGTRLPPALYILGLVICVALLTLWFVRGRRRAP
jgi:hypothetical protein